MNPKQVMFMGLIFSVGTLISLTFGGLWLGGSEQSIATSVATFKQTNILGIWSVTVPNINFFLLGVAALLNMDFAFFAGPLQFLQWILYMVLGLGLMWGLYSVAIGVINGLFRRA